ncbi:helix-turn-helix domain-containing protein [Chitinophagaceae bacterium MMS25-I14]
MKLYIKNMVCNRCIMVVEHLLNEEMIPWSSVLLGEVETSDDLSDTQLKQLNDALHVLGFSLIDDRKSRIIEQIKNEVIALVHYSNDEQPRENLSSLLAAKLNYDYKYLSNLFSSVEGTTIEQYIIAQKIERVKELLVYDELTLSQISLQMGYSSVAHLSNQFKKVTGLTPTYFKQVKENKRRPLDEL